MQKCTTHNVYLLKLLCSFLSFLSSFFRGKRGELNFVTMFPEMQLKSFDMICRNTVWPLSQVKRVRIAVDWSRRRKRSTASVKHRQWPDGKRFEKRTLLSVTCRKYRKPYAHTDIVYSDGFAKPPRFAIWRSLAWSKASSTISDERIGSAIRARLHASHFRCRATARPRHPAT